MAQTLWTALRFVADCSNADFVERVSIRLADAEIREEMMGHVIGGEQTLRDLLVSLDGGVAAIQDILNVRIKTDEPE